MGESAHAVAPDEESGARPEIEVYDFGRPAALSRDDARVLELAFETFARQWAAQLSARIRSRAQVSVESVSMQTYDEYVDSLPTTTTMVVCAVGESDPRIILQFPISSATSWIVQMVGGKLTTPPAEDRVLTPLEQALVRALAGEALDSLSHALSGFVPTGASVVGIHYSSQFAQVGAAGDLVVVARLPVRSAGRSVSASVMIPAPLVLAGFAHSGAVPHAAAPGLMLRQVELSPIELALRLAPRTVRPREVLELSVGDLLSLPHAADRPLDLVVGGHPVATAAVGSSGARLACVVTATTPDPAEEPA